MFDSISLRRGSCIFPYGAATFHRILDYGCMSMLNRAIRHTARKIDPFFTFTNRRYFKWFFVKILRLLSLKEEKDVFVVAPETTIEPNSGSTLTMINTLFEKPPSCVVTPIDDEP